MKRYKLVLHLGRKLLREAEEKAETFFLRFGFTTLFIYFYINRADIQYLYIVLVEYHSFFFIASAQWASSAWGAEPRIEIGSALPYSKPTLSYLSHTAKFSVQVLVLDILKQASSEIPEVLYCTQGSQEM